MTLYIYIWLYHHLGHAITHIKHLGKGKGSIWELLATVTTEGHSLSNRLVSALLLLTPLQPFHVYSKSRE